MTKRIMIALIVFAAICNLAATAGQLTKPATPATEQSAAIDAELAELTPETRNDLGQALTPKDEILFGGAMSVRAYQRAFFVAYKQADTTTVEKIVLQYPSPKTPPLGDILTVYNSQKGKQTYGSGLEGEHMMFSEQFRVHVFEHAVLVWRHRDRSVQAATFKREFRPAK